MKKLMILPLVAVLAGCGASFNKYEPMTGWGGYSNTQVNNDTYEVRAVVNFKTQAQVAKDYALTRAAQIACDKGYPFFEIIDQSFTTTTGKRSSDYFTISDMTVKLHRSDTGGSFYDAHIVYREMGQKYTLPDSCQF